MWDPSGDTLQPVLVLSRGRGAVRSLGVIWDLGLLAAAHATGKVGLVLLRVVADLDAVASCPVCLHQLRTLATVLSGACPIF